MNSSVGYSSLIVREGGERETDIHSKSQVGICFGWIPGSSAQGRCGSSQLDLNLKNIPRVTHGTSISTLYHVLHMGQV